MIIFKVSEDQLVSFRKAFDGFDRNKTGKIEKEELGELMKSLHIDLDEVELEEVMKALDVNENNVIDFDEFVDLMTVASECPQERMSKAFQLFDKNGDGRVAKEDFKQIMEGLGEKLSEEEVEEMFLDFDADSDGKINYQQFLEIMESGSRPWDGSIFNSVANVNDQPIKK